MSTHDTSLPLLGELSTEEFRQRLAGLIDPSEQLGLTDREEVRLTAIDFAACLPQVFGDDLDRTTLWDRIGSGLQTAFAKTVGDDVEFFISEVCRHIHAGTAAARCEALCEITMRVSAWECEQREAWMRYLTTHLPIVLVHARAAWESQKKTRKKGGAK